MIALPLSPNLPLRESSRLPVGVSTSGLSMLRDLALILLAGFTAALSVHFLDFSLRIPGHAILRSILPISLGIALVPRRLSGSLIAASAVGSSMLLERAGAEGVGAGAFTSMLLSGPVFDIAMWQANAGFGIYLRCILVGLLTNSFAFVIRGGGKLGGWDALTMRPFSQWWSQAALSYVICGLIAGLIVAIAWFRWSPRKASIPVESAP